MRPDQGFSTRSIHAGEAPDPSTGAHGVPIYQNATYGFPSFESVDAWHDGMPHFHYQRDGNPTTRCLELKLANLEGAESAVATASGMAAISATLLHVLAGGGHLIASRDLYGTTTDLLREDLPGLGATVSLVDCCDLAAVEARIGDETRAILVEAFSNPRLRVVDLKALSGIARERGIALIVDNTFLSPALLRPIELGADLVIHSATKYLSGHGNVLGGVVCGSRAQISEIRSKLSRLGGTMSPFSAWLLLAGIKTLALRVERHSANAAALASLLANHPAVESVHYPGLPNHPQHDVARALVGDRFGGMLSFSMRGCDDAIRRLLRRLEIPIIAVSLGNTATLVWPMIGSNLVRVSVGLEDWADLKADFTAALAEVESTQSN
jgi:cystathionine beta-lyase/cystathionine gamma-synthase